MEQEINTETLTEEKARYFDLLWTKPWNLNSWWPRTSDDKGQFTVVDFMKSRIIGEGSTPIEAIRNAVKNEEEGI